MTSPNESSDLASGRRRVVVVGGGISGLAAAWFLSRAVNAPEVIVLEGSPRVGGKLLVGEIEGLPVDEGAESLLARRTEATDLVRAIGLGADLVEPATTTAGVWSRGQMRSLPRGTVMGVPSDLAALAASGVLSVRGLARVPLDRARPASAFTRGELEDVAIGAYVEERLGAEVADRLVEPLLGGVYAGRARELSLTATVPTLAAAARVEPSLLAAAASLIPRADPSAAGEPAVRAPSVFASLRGGLGRLPAALSTASGAEIRTGTTVRALRRVGSGWQLVVGPVPAEQVIDADAVVLAVPATPLARLLDIVAPSAAAEIASIEYASVALVTLVYRQDQLSGVVAGSGFLVPPVERRVIKAATIMTNKWGWMSAAAGDLVVVRCSVGRHREAGILKRDDADLSSLVERDLAGLAGVQGNSLASRVSRWGGALPQYAVGHPARVARIRDAVDALPGLAVCGATLDGVGVAACVASAHVAAARVLAGLLADGL